MINEIIDDGVHEIVQIIILRTKCNIDNLILLIEGWNTITEQFEIYS